MQRAAARELETGGIENEGVGDHVRAKTPRGLERPPELRISVRPSEELFSLFRRTGEQELNSCRDTRTGRLT